MTTILYDHKNKQIACDSRQSTQSFINSDVAIKYKYAGAVLWFLSGNPAGMDEFISEFDLGGKAPKNCNCNGLFINGGLVYSAFAESGKYCSELLTSSDSFGSGCWLAIAALDFNKSAKDAVEYAMTRDSNTGGKIHVYDIAKAEFI